LVLQQMQQGLQGRPQLVLASRHQQRQQQSMQR
jgi:hypothetical protein